jgi:hypothetical protein
MATKERMTYIKNEAGHYVCPDCGVTKEKQNTMHCHMRKCRDMLPNVCQYCKKKFLQKASLDLHLAHQAGRGDHPSDSAAAVAEFECPFDGCATTSSDKGNCRTHCMRTHVPEAAKLLERLGPKEFNCKNCGRISKSLGAFYYHSIGCITLEVTDPRHAILAQLA